MSTPTITFWHDGIGKVVTGTPTGKVSDRKIWICQAWHTQGKLIEIRWHDGKGTTYTTSIPETNILDLAA